MSCSLTQKPILTCSHCSYTTNRKYNLERHIGTVHFESAPKYIPNAPKYIPNAPKYIPNAPKYIPKDEQTENTLVCQKCNVTFARKFTLYRHVERGCKGTFASNECPYCHLMFTNISNKYRHMKICKSKDIVTASTSELAKSESQPNVHNVVNNGSIDTQNVIQNQQNNIILNFPNGIEDRDFAFIKDHITMGKFEKLIGNNKPAIGFSKYMGAIMQRPENRMIYKTNPNTKHCKIYNDKEWEYVLDEDAFPVLTYHMTCAALEDTHKYKKISKRPKIDIVSLLQYLDDVNTENDDNSNYKAAVERLKLNIINLSQRYKIPHETPALTS